MKLLTSVQNFIHRTIIRWSRGIVRLRRRYKIILLLAFVLLGCGIVWIGITPGRLDTPTAQNPAATRSDKLPPPQHNTSSVPTVDPVAGARTYPEHTHVVATTFWVGEVFQNNVSDGSQICSTYDKSWAFHWSGGINSGLSPAGTACEGSSYGGCDGISSHGGRTCETEIRTAENGYFPTRATPAENPFYLDLPFDDLNDPTAFAHRCQIIPWANDPGYKGHCADPHFSYMKNHWVKLIGLSGNVCYGQIEDAGPSHDSLYHDSAYVFGSDNMQPIQGKFNNAGADVSPALNSCLGFRELNGETDRISWQFVDDMFVPAGPWRRIVTTSGVTQ